MTADLPVGLAEPLHILEPAAEGSVAPWLLVLALVAALLLLWLRWRARRAVPVLPPTDSPMPDEGVGILGQIWEIRKKYSRRFDRRRGCHELSTVLRDYLEPRLPATVSSPGPDGSKLWRRRPPLAALTAREIAALLGYAPLGRFLVHLSRHQFGRTKPDEDTFAELCDLATEAVQKTPDDLP